VRSATHPESTTAEVETRMEHIAQMCLPASMQGFWFSGNLT
jgi:hypothetical protein